MFSVLKKSTTGDNLAAIFLDAYKKLNLTGSIFAIATDNASNMLRMADKVSEMIRHSYHSVLKLVFIGCSVLDMC